jgi:hypothetical protein
MMKGSIEEILPMVDQFVEATSFERHILWERFNELYDWVECEQLLGMEVGPHDTYVTFWLTTINGKLVAFYEPTSAVVYWDDVKKFIRSFGKPYTDATNYHPIK